MINRFHNAAPSVAAPSVNSQANKAKVGDGFSLLLNALADPVAEQQTRQNPPQLLEEPSVGATFENIVMPFNRLVDAPEVGAGLSTNPLFLTTPLSSSTATTTLQNVLAPMQAEAYLPQVVAIIPDSEIPVTAVPVTMVNEARQLAFPSMVTAPDPEVIAASVISSELLVVEEPVSIKDSEKISVTSASLVPHNINDAHVIISKHTALQGGDVELLAVPWRLQANAAMSYESIAQQVKDIGDTQSVLTTIIQATTTLVVDKAQLPVLSSNGSQFDDIKIDKTLEFYRVSEAASTLASAFESTRSQRADSRASLIMWPQRVLHWLTDGDTTTAWVRDYQLDASGTRTLIDALRCFAEQQSFSLRRIMLNGHEAWRSPSTF